MTGFAELCAATNYSFLRGTFSHEETWPAGWGALVRGGWQVAAQPLI